MNGVNGPEPIALPAPGQPLDRGATSLGLVLLTYTTLVELPLGLLLVIWTGHVGSPLGALAMLVTIARVACDGIAGHRLASDPYGSRATVRTAVIVGVLHAISIALLVDGELAPFAFAGLAVYPIALGVVARRRAFAGVKTTELRGEPAVAAIVAAISGLFSLAPFAGFLAYLAAPGGRVDDAATICFAFGIVALGSLLLIRAALVGPSGAAVANALRWAERYTLVAGSLIVFASVVVTFGVGLILFLPLFVVFALIRFARNLAERQRDPIDPEVSRGAARLAIAWLLLGQGLLTLIHPLLPAVDGRELLLWIAGGWSTGSVWVHAAIGALEVWVAIELLAGTRRARPLAALWAIAVIGVLAHDWLATWRSAGAVIEDHWQGDHEAGRVMAITSYTWTLLVIPAATLWVLRRPYTALTARASRRA